MKLRLAFAVIAHLKTDIIALDEVLAVGDSMFQLACLERIFDFKKEGRTVLFVSHNLSAVKKLCDRTILLEKGQIVFDGSTSEAIEKYLSLNQHTNHSASQFIKSIDVSGTENRGSLTLEIADLANDSSVDFGVNICDKDGADLYHFSNRFNNSELVPSNGKLSLSLNFRHHLKPGNYPVSIFIGQNGQEVTWVERACTLVVPPYNPYGFHNPAAIQGPIISEFKMKVK